MNLELEAYEGELEKLRRVHTMVRHLSAEKLDGVFFICGEGGAKDAMGLPEKIMVCPAYGLDGFAIYTKTSNYSAPDY
jgi:hypothetical protein